MPFPARILMCFQLLLGFTSIVPVGRTAELQIRIHDCYGIGPGTIGKSISELRTILFFTRTDIDVIGCGDKASPASAERSNDPWRPEVWIVRGRVKIPNNRRQPLGYSVVTENGGHSFIFGKTVLAQADAADVPWSVLIAYVAAHEIGHLILGISHSATGLMKPNWDRNDIQAMYRRSIHFSDEQQRVIAAYCDRSGKFEMAQKSSSRVPSRGHLGRVAD